METVAVLDFETTGLSPRMGDRATEIAVVLVRDGQVVDRYQSLMNAGARIPSFIERLTGITNDMIRAAPGVDKVMREAAAFVGDHPLVAHNAAFDRSFWDAELERVGKRRGREFACSMLVARRLYPGAPSHKLAELIAYTRLDADVRYHRALADAEMAAKLLFAMEGELRRRGRLRDVTHDLLLKVQRVPKHQLDKWLERLAIQA